MRIVVITNCTARKSERIPHRRRARSLSKDKSIKKIARVWKARLREAKDRIAVRDLYLGRSFTEARKASTLAGTNLYVVSAGVGLVRESDRVSSYSLTIGAEHEDSLRAKVVGWRRSTASEWWKALYKTGVATRSIKRLIKRNKDAVFVLALSAPYVSLVSAELEALSDQELRRVRLVGPRSGSELPSRLRRCWMPYDRRLNGRKSPLQGTEADFPQRAAHHFVQLIKRKPGKRPEVHARAVKRAMRSWSFRRRVMRTRVTDVQLRRLVTKAIKRSGGRLGRGLRILRDEWKIACEQNRFRKACGLLRRKRLR
jgi:hypothetical protein